VPPPGLFRARGVLCHRAVPGGNGAGAVEATAFLCVDHTAVESPMNLDDAYEGYVFHVEPVAAGDGN